MATIPDDLTTFLAEHRDSREYRRALAVKLALQGYLYDTIGDMLDITPGFISQAKNAYEAHGVAGLRLKYTGSQPYLSHSERKAVIAWIQAQKTWSIEQLRTYIEATYAVVFQSQQSYYQLLSDAGISYKKAQQINPRRNPERIASKKRDTSAPPGE